MAQYWYDFAALANLDDFTTRQLAQTFELVSDGGSNSLRVTTTTNTRSWAMWPTDVSATTNAMVRIYGRQGQHQNVRGAGGAVFIDTSFGQLGSSISMGFTLVARSASSETLVVDGSVVHSADVVDALNYHYIELLRNGNAAEARWWAGDVVTDRPSTAQGTGTRATDTTSGPVGLYGYQNAGNTYFVKTLAIGTDGDPAPTGPVGGARRRSPLLLTPW